MRVLLGLAVVALVLAGCDEPDIAKAPERDASTGEPSDGGGSAFADAQTSFSIDAGSLDAAFVFDEPADADAEADTRDAAALPYARDVVSFHEGANAGYGFDRFPSVVLGPPMGRGTNAGSLDVLSLGVGGEIVLDFGTRAIVDGAGPDFIVFENPFWPGGDATKVFAELGEVSISDDLTHWLTFPCSTQAVTPGVFPGCAGWTPTLRYDAFEVMPLDPARTGGDAFDLRTVSATHARYVRVRDLSTMGDGENAGFDLDAIGIIHADKP